MSKLSALLVWLTIPAVAVFPTVGMASPCCGKTRAVSAQEPAQELPPTRSCCQEEHVAAEALPAENITPHAACQRHPGYKGHSRQWNECCCESLPPATAPSTRDSAAEISHVQHVIAAEPAVIAVVPSEASAIDRGPPGENIKLSGMPLLALYCIWLK